MLKLKKIIKVLIFIIALILITVLILIFNDKIIYEENTFTNAAVWVDRKTYIYNSGKVKIVTKSDETKMNGTSYYYISNKVELNDLKEKINNLSYTGIYSTGDKTPLSVSDYYAYKNNKKMGLSKNSHKEIIGLADKIIQDIYEKNRKEK